MPSVALEDEDDESEDVEPESVDELPLEALPEDPDDDVPDDPVVPDESAEPEESEPDVVPDEEEVPDCVVVVPLPAAPDEAPVAMVEATEVPAPDGLRMRTAATPRAVAPAVMPPVTQGRMVTRFVRLVGAGDVPGEAVVRRSGPLRGAGAPSVTW